MHLLDYNQYILEKALYDLLLESKLVLSNKFTKIISKIKDNKIAYELLKLNRSEVENIKQNYIDITSDNDKVSFIPDKKAKDLNINKEELYKVTQSNRYLTHSYKNDKVFEELGYDKENRENWAPSEGTIGKVLGETTRPSGKTYVLFEEFTQGSEPRLTVLNKEAISPYSYENEKVWTKSRNPMNVGRLVRSILKVSGFDFKDSEIEDFVNKYKATYNFLKDSLVQFDIVSGSDIAYWYDSNRYSESGGGTLYNSCMGDVNSYFFDIYVYNTAQVKLVILYDDNGEINDKGKYISDKIKGRALLWDCKIDGSNQMFLDRIYTNSDSDVELFKQYAEKNGWWYKTKQSMEPEQEISNGSIRKKAEIVCWLDHVHHDYYPYMDTLCYISTTENLVTNNIRHGSVSKMARDTDGEISYL